MFVDINQLTHCSCYAVWTLRAILHRKVFYQPVRQFAQGWSRVHLETIINEILAVNVWLSATNIVKEQYYIKVIYAV